MKNITRKAIIPGFLSCLLFLILISANSLKAQTLPEEILEGSDPQSARSHIAITSFRASGMTESTAHALGMRLAQNLQNTNHFVVTDPDSLRTQLGQASPDLLGCVDLGCSIRAGKVIGADRIIYGKISLDKDERFKLVIQLVHVATSTLDYEDIYIFNDDDIDKTFHILSRKLVENTPLEGFLTEVNNITATISMGSEQGIQEGDQLVIFKDRKPQSNQPVDLNSSSAPTENTVKNIGILKVTQVTKKAAKGIYFQKVELPTKGQKVRTFLNRSRQIMLISDVRKELDTFERMTYDEVPTTIVEQVELVDNERGNWVNKVRQMERQRDMFQMILTASAVTSVYAITQISSDTNDWRVLLPLGFTGYSTFGYIQSRARLNELVDEGRYKGYIDLRLFPVPGGVSMNMEWRF